jgi:cytochrome b
LRWPIPAAMARFASTEKSAATSMQYTKLFVNSRAKAQHFASSTKPAHVVMVYTVL